MFKKSEKKDYTNHKNRKYSILLLALLFIGVATYGTYAYFTDSKSVDGQLTLTKGTVSLAADNGEWTYVGNTKDNADITARNFVNPQITLNSKSTNNAFSNVLPGDVFEKNVKLTYNGSVDSTIKVDFTKTAIAGLDYKVVYAVGTGDKTELTAKTDLTDLLTSKNKEVTFYLTVRVPYNTNEEGASKDSRNTTGNFLEAFDQSITVTAEQKLNAKQ